MYDLLVRGGLAVTPAGTWPLDVAVKGERIAALLPPGEDASAARVLEAAGCYVLPGGVDPHVHFNMTRPGFPDVRGESQTYSYAAALGGTTTIIDFAVREGTGSLREAIEKKRRECEGVMAVDYGLHALLAGDIPSEVIEEIPQVVADGLPTVKTLTIYTFASDDGQRFGLMRAVADAGGMSVIHAEDEALTRWFTARLMREGKTYGAYIADARNALVEEAAVRRVLLLAERAGSPLYILHMAAGDGVRALADARSRGLPVYGETLAAYLSFTADDLWRDGDAGLLRNNYPTPKSQADQDLLWEAIQDGRLQVVASDHNVYPARARLELVGRTVDRMSGGQAATELRLPLLFHLGVQMGRISIERFVELVSTNPARIHGLYPRKGTLELGADADIVVLDPERWWTVRQAELHMSADWCAWEGWQLRGKVRHTTLRGTVLVENSSFVGARRAGRFQPRRLLPEIVAARTPTNAGRAPVAAG